LNDWHETEVRVRYADTDQMGIVHHAAFLEYFEEGRSDWLRSRGLSYGEVEARGVFLAVTEATARYRRPARYDQLLTVRTRVAEVRKASLLLAYQVLREGELLAEGSTRLAATGRDGRPRRLPDALRALVGEDPSAGAAR
jgi:acyl-CoA thioester hydrolase